MMQARFVIGGGLILGAFVVIAVMAFFANQELYLSVDELVGDPQLYASHRDGGDAEASHGETGEIASPSSRKQRLQVRGVVDYDTVERPNEGLELRFTLTGTDARLPVRYEGIVPDTFDQAEAVTVAGYVASDGTFVADDLVVQCPSKYEAVPPGEQEAGVAGRGTDG